jgi:phosphatidylserine/phosphatidylglycerophosphate/cardiolipin synthase-like enzyme
MSRATPPLLRRALTISLLADDAHYTELMQKAVAGARVSIWIATANVKEMRVEAPLGSVARARGRYVSILDTFDGLAQRGVELRLLHAGLPSRAFRAELARRPRLLAGGLEMRRCPRVHLKIIAVDGAQLYLGSANFTGAGLGAKGSGRRNFELGVITDDDVVLDAVQARFERIWSGAECGACKLRDLCPAPLDLPARIAAAVKPAAASPARRASSAASAKKKAPSSASGPSRGRRRA